MTTGDRIGGSLGRLKGTPVLGGLTSGGRIGRGPVTGGMNVHANERMNDLGTGELSVQLIGGMTTEGMDATGGAGILGEPDGLKAPDP